MEIILIAAVARNSVIGNNGEIPWDIPEDLKRFKTLTSGHTVIMGRKTFDSIGAALPDRENIVVSRSVKELSGCTVVDNLDDAFDLASGKVFVIGGGEVFSQVISKAETMFITHVDSEVEGDVVFPEFSKDEWNQVDCEVKNGYIFAVYRRD